MEVNTSIHNKISIDIGVNVAIVVCSMVDHICDWPLERQREPTFTKKKQRKKWEILSSQKTRNDVKDGTKMQGGKTMMLCWVPLRTTIQFRENTLTAAYTKSSKDGATPFSNASG